MMRLGLHYLRRCIEARGESSAFKWLNPIYDGLSHFAIRCRASNHLVRLALLFLLVSSVLTTWLLSYDVSGVVKYVADAYLDSYLAPDGDGDGQEIGTDLLCMFTTFKPSVKKTTVYKNVLFNWAALAPKGVIRPILYDTTLSKIKTEAHMHVKATKNTTQARPQFMQELFDLAETLDWHVSNLPYVSPIGVPYFKDMYFYAAEQFPACKFYGFANGDIMFDKGLLNTLVAVHKVIETLDETLLIGRRTNVLTEKLASPTFFTSRDVRMIAKSAGKLYHPLANDFFIVYKNRFPWHAIPDVVIGRVLYDNFIVWTAYEQKVSVIDVTKTVIALHQTDMEGNGAGRRNKYSDVNKGIIGKFDPRKARTDDSKFYTAAKDNAANGDLSELDFQSAVIVHRRTVHPTIGLLRHFARHHRRARLTLKRQHHTVRKSHKWRRHTTRIAHEPHPMIAHEPHPIVAAQTDELQDALSHEPHSVVAKISHKDHRRKRQRQRRHHLKNRRRRHRKV